jgi:hypothetical protein
MPVGRTVGIVMLLVIGRGHPSFGQTPGIAGTWEGTSQCVGNRPSCNNEKVVYHIGRPNGDSVTVQADRMADGRAVDMGALKCGFDGSVNSVTCPIPLGTWRFQVEQEQLRGTLTLKDNSVVRRVVAHRASPT